MTADVAKWLIRRTPRGHQRARAGPVPGGAAGVRSQRDAAAAAGAAAQAGLPPEQADAALRELAAAELVTLDGSGALAGAFPLSATRTRQRVRVDDGRVLHAMCAIDALGVPSMLGQAGVVTSTDPATGIPSPSTSAPTAGWTWTRPAPSCSWAARAATAWPDLLARSSTSTPTPTTPARHSLGPG